MPGGRRFRKTINGHKVDLSERQVTALWFQRVSYDEAREVFGSGGAKVFNGLVAQGCADVTHKGWRRTAFGSKVQKLAEKAGFTLKGSATLTTKSK